MQFQNMQPNKKSNVHLNEKSNNEVMNQIAYQKTMNSRCRLLNSNSVIQVFNHFKNSGSQSNLINLDLNGILSKHDILHSNYNIQKIQ
jgi:hypothetical protein